MYDDIKSKYNVNIFYKVYDLSKIETIKKTFKECINLTPNKFVHGFIYSSWQTDTAPLKVININKIKEIYSLNVFGFIKISRCYSLQNFINKEGCNIVAISSTSAKNKNLVC